MKKTLVEVTVSQSPKDDYDWQQYGPVFAHVFTGPLTMKTLGRELRKLSEAFERVYGDEPDKSV